MVHVRAGHLHAEGIHVIDEPRARDVAAVVGAAVSGVDDPDPRIGDVGLKPVGRDEGFDAGGGEKRKDRRPAPRPCRSRRLDRCAAASMPRASPDTIDEPCVTQIAGDPLGEFRAGARTHCASRPPRSCSRPARWSCRARRARAARRRSSAAAPDIRVRRARSARCRAFSIRPVRARPLARENTHGLRCAAAPRQLRQGVECRPRAAAMIDQAAEGAQAHRRA